MTDQERLENMSPIGVDGAGNVLIKGEDWHWLAEKAELVQELEEDLKLSEGEERRRWEEVNYYREALESIQDIQQWNREQPDYEVLNIVNKALEDSE